LVIGIIMKVHQDRKIKSNNYQIKISKIIINFIFSSLSIINGL